MSDLSELYQEVILDHNKRPRNFHKLEGANRVAEGYNPSFGDQITLYLKIEGDVIRDISFVGSGCAISNASASLITVSLKGKTKLEAQSLFQKVHEMFTGALNDEAKQEEFEKLEVFFRVCQFPARVKCASLAWYTLLAALEGKGERVSTE